MTRQERETLRRLVDKAARLNLRNQKARLQRAGENRRNPYWRAYYWANRDRILKQRALRKMTVLKDEAA